MKAHGGSRTSPRLKECCASPVFVRAQKHVVVGPGGLHHPLARCRRATSRQTTASTPTTARLSNREAGTIRMRKFPRVGCTSQTGFEPKAQLDDPNSNQFASALSDSEKSSTGTLSLCTCSATDRVATTILVSESSHCAPRYRLRQQTHTIYAHQSRPKLLGTFQKILALCSSILLGAHRGRFKQLPRPTFLRYQDNTQEKHSAFSVVSGFGSPRVASEGLLDRRRSQPTIERNLRSL